MSVVSTAPVVAISTASDVKPASASEGSAQPFGSVLAHEMTRQENETKAETSPAKTPATDETPAEETEQQTQQAAISPWLLMLQQQTALSQQESGLPLAPQAETAALSQQDGTTDILGQSTGQMQGWLLLLAQGVPPNNASTGTAGEKGQATLSPTAATITVGALGSTKPALATTTLSPTIPAIPTANTFTQAELALSTKTASPTSLAMTSGNDKPVGDEIAPLLSQQAAKVSSEAGKGLPEVAPEAGLAATFSSEVTEKPEAAGETQQAIPPLLMQARHAEQATGRSEVAQHTVAEPVGDARWGDAVAQRVSIMLGRQEQQMEMQLNPPHLGPMEVRLTLGSDQASVIFTSQHAAVREALSAATPRLSALLADQGIQLVNVQVASDSLHQHAQDQSHQQAAFNGQQGGQRRETPRYGADDVAIPRILGNLSVPVARSGVSLYV